MGIHFIVPLKTERPVVIFATAFEKGIAESGTFCQQTSGVTQTEKDFCKHTEASDVHHVPELFRKEKISEPAAGGGKMLIKRVWSAYSPIKRKQMSTIEQANYLEQLESESIYILREVAGQFERPALLLAEGKIVLHWRIWLLKLSDLEKFHSPLFM